MGEDRKVYKILVGEFGGKRALRRQKRRWEDGIKMDLKEIGWGEEGGFSWLSVGTGGGFRECGYVLSGCESGLSLIGKK
jgi:hypothetical protein